MSELSVLIIGLKAAKEELRTDLQRQVVKAVNDMVALTINRVTTKGENAEGKPFTPYSTKQTGAWRYRGKSRTDAAEKKINAKAKAKEDLSYKEFREVNGLKADKKIFEFTGEMWRKTGVISVNSNVGDFVTVTVGASGGNNKLKLSGNSDREGINIAAPSTAEKALVKTYLDGWIQSTIKKHS